MNLRPLYIGVMGFSTQSFDEEMALQMLKGAFNRIAKHHPNRAIAVVSGYTNLGIPKLAYCEAALRNWKTVGIACSKAYEYPVFPCDEVEIVGTNWGDESQTFLVKCQIFVRIGGGKQSLREIELAKSAGKDVLEYDLQAQ